MLTDEAALMAGLLTVSIDTNLCYHVALISIVLMAGMGTVGIETNSACALWGDLC